MQRYAQTTRKIIFAGLNIRNEDAAKTPDCIPAAPHPAVKAPNSIPIGRQYIQYSH
jgi:hypothetical protein